MSIEFLKNNFLQGNQDTILSSIQNSKQLNEKLLLIESLIYLNKFELALNELNMIDINAPIRKEGTILLLLLKALCLVHPNEKNEAFQLLDSAEKILLKIKNSTIPLHEEFIIFLFSKGQVLINFQFLDQSLTFFDQCVRECITVSNKYYQAKSLNKLSRVYFEKELFDRSQESTMKALAISTANNYLFEIVQGYEMLGLINQTKNTDQSLKYFDYCLKLAVNQLQNDVLIAKALMNIAKTKLLQKNLDEAQQFFSESLTLFSKAAYDSDKPLILMNLGNIHLRRGNYRDAIDQYKQGLGISNNQGKIVVQSQILFSLGSVYFRIRDFNNALKYYKESLSLKRTFANKIDFAGPLWGIGHIYFIKRNYEKAMKSYLELYDIYREFGKPEYIAEILLIIVTLYDNAGDQDAIRQYLSFLSKLSIDNYSAHTSLAYSIALAISKSESRLEQFNSKFDLFSKINTNLDINQHFTYYCLLNLLLIEVSEYLIIKEEEIFHEIRATTLILRDFAIKNYNFSIELFSNLILILINYITGKKAENESLLIKITLMSEQIHIKPIDREMTKILKKIDQLEKKTSVKTNPISPSDTIQQLGLNKFITGIITGKYWL